jgi:ribonuclease J
MVIPGNEAFVDKITQQLKERDIHVIQQNDTQHTIHVSGHANAENLAQMYRWVKPKCAIPTHGESYHMGINAHIAQQNGVPLQLTGRNGDLFVIAPEPSIQRQVSVPSRIPIDQ